VRQIILLATLSPPVVRSPIPHHGKQPARKLARIDGREVLVEREKRIARQLLGDVTPPDTSHGKSENCRSVLPVERVDVCHYCYG
jgi:hypothetical protein